MPSLRPLSVTTPLGPDALLLAGFSGQEALSTLFRYQLDLLASNSQTIAFDALLGQPLVVTVSQPGHRDRPIAGICSSLTEGARIGGSTVFHAELVPQLWLLTRRRNSRIFQQKSVPEIVSRVMAGVDVSFELKGTYLQRDYCVQYRESDFDFASRLMEDEGIFYFFRHSPAGHLLVVADTPQSHADLPDGSTIAFDRSARPGTIHEWSKTQELRSGKITLWDSNFELPHKHLEAEALIPDSVPVGQVIHRLRVAGNDKLELYDYPGGYAKRFDGIDPAGGDRSSDLAHIPADAQRTAGIRMQEEAAAGLQIEGASACASFATGYRFMLDGHFDGNGQYVLTSVQHTAALRGGRLAYTNRFTAIPLDLPYRPPRTTPRPAFHGPQTAFVIGPAGQQTFADKYGRVKVQFHWDREGRSDASSSAWVRVAALHAGSESGFVATPRIGQEVVVAFEEGDPDRPIIVGSVYDPEQLPPSGSQQ